MRRQLHTLIAMFLAVWTFAGCDDSIDIPASQVPGNVLQAFEQTLPGITPLEWEKENGLYKAEFYKEGHEGEVWFKPDGTWVRTETDVRIFELPTEVTDYVATNFPTHHIDDASWVETPAQAYYALELEKNGKRDKHLKILPNGEPIS